MTDQKRPYRMKRRAELEQETRRRITESAVELHGTLGPANTSVSAVAEHAGVQRSTVYRHFPDEAALFDACSAHWGRDHPAPDPGRWAAIGDPGERLAVALGELYAWYRDGERMIANLLRDEPLVSVVAERFGPYHGMLEAARELLLAGRDLTGAAERRTRAAIGHALAFATWRSLAREQGLADADAVRLMERLVAGAAERDEVTILP
jgi:AcrR family transcriptional regulator